MIPSRRLMRPLIDALDNSLILPWLTLDLGPFGEDAIPWLVRTDLEHICSSIVIALAKQLVHVALGAIHSLAPHARRQWLLASISTLQLLPRDGWQSTCRLANLHLSSPSTQSLPLHLLQLSCRLPLKRNRPLRRPSRILHLHLCPLCPAVIPLVLRIPHRRLRRYNRLLRRRRLRHRRRDRRPRRRRLLHPFPLERHRNAPPTEPTITRRRVQRLRVSDHQDDR